MASQGFREDTIGLYERGRPGYNVDQVQHALREAMGAHKGGIVLADVGSGTGKALRATSTALSREFPDAKLVMHAVEPTSLGEELARSVPGLDSANVHRTGAGSLPFEDGSVDVLSVGQAFHWFATDETVAEFARVLKPSGTLLLAWNTRNAMATLPWSDSPQARAQSAETIMELGGTLLRNSGDGDGEGGIDSSHDDAKRHAVQRALEMGTDLLPCILEAAVEHHYGPAVPRQQSGRWTGLFELDAGDDARFGPFGPFPAEAIMLGSTLLSYMEAEDAATGGQPVSEFDPAAFFRKAEGVDMTPAPDTPVTGRAPEASPFAPLRHSRVHECVPMTRKQLRSNVSSISVVAAAPSEARTRTETYLDLWLFQAAIRSSSGELQMPYMRDVFVGKLRQ